MLVPLWLVRTLCIVCFILNTISILLCFSALFLLIMSYLGFEHLFIENSDSSNFPTKEITSYNNSLSPLLFAVNRSISSTAQPLNKSSQMQASTPSSTSFPGHNSEQHFSLIVYLIFYLITAILGVLGAHTLYNSRKIYFLMSHALLLFSIICFNLIAWFEFKDYSPLSLSPYEDSHLLLAALFDFIDLLVALCLITALTINCFYVNRKRNSINPIENGNGYAS